MSEPAEAVTSASTSRDPNAAVSASSHVTAMHAAHHPPKDVRELAWLSLGALGVVYGDIGTSPLYAMRECLTNTEHVTVSPNDAANVLGVTSLFFWALTLVVVIKYLVFIMRADN